ncbi:hypothetical protein [Filifactor alocis]|uniref:hypothetical protein n=1 Tax=Filifactor alocis TaxID=143361 RepID=UPI0028D650C6|nr:hypothetical protein [Filifactor alocis]
MITEMQNRIYKDKIIPIRFIPFDIGCAINANLSESIKNTLNQTHKCNEILQDDDVMRLLSISSIHLIFAFHIDDKIDLYVFDFGIGVCTVKDDVFAIEQENYAHKYCDLRKKVHEEYLKSRNANSIKIREIANTLRSLASESVNRLRYSANDKWENGGLSYVMTVSNVIKTDFNAAYDHMSDDEKLNLHIMLEPSIAHKEDSLVYSCYQEIDTEAHIINLSQLDIPENFLFGDKNAIYISWAAVLLYYSEVDIKMQNIVTALEVGLQAMWMNTYCMYEDLILSGKEKRLLVSQLQTKLFTFRRTFNEFKGISDSSIPSYITRIRNELLRTSGIDEYAEKYQAELEYLIAETDSINAEKQKKYSWLNELLLFLIAFIQIAPMLYDVLSNGFPSLKLFPVIIMALMIVVAAIILIKKD